MRRSTLSTGLRATAAALLLTLGSLPASGAPLYAGLAERFDQAAPDCAPIGAGSGRPQPALCANQRAPEDYCSGFASSPLLEADAESQKARQSCVRFYTSALAAQQLLCDYEKDLAQLQENSAGTQKQIRNCAAKMYSYYSEASLLVAAELAGLRRLSQQDTKALAQEGAQRLLAEVHCLKTGVPGKVPGTVQIGLSTHTEADQKKTYDQLSKTLHQLSVGLESTAWKSWGESDNALIRTALQALEEAKNELSGGNKPPTCSTEIPDPNAPNSRTVDLIKTGKQMSQDSATTVGKRLFTNPGPALREIIHDALFATAPVEVEEAFQSGGTTLLAGLGATYLFKGEIKPEDVLQSLYVTGATVTLGLVGAPPLATIGVTEGIAFTATEIQRYWSKYEAETILKPYQEFARAAMQENPSITSEQLAQKYADRKSHAWYCQDCTPGFNRGGCMQKEAPISKYNKYGVVAPALPTR